MSYNPKKPLPADAPGKPMPKLAVSRVMIKGAILDLTFAVENLEEIVRVLGSDPVNAIARLEFCESDLRDALAKVARARGGDVS